MTVCTVIGPATFESWPLPVSVLGVGEASFAKKLESVSHQFTMVCGDAEQHSAFRKSIFGVMTDQAGTERQFADCGKVHNPEVADAVVARAESAAGPDADAYYFENGMGVTDPMHIIFNSASTFARPCMPFCTPRRSGGGAGSLRARPLFQTKQTNDQARERERERERERPTNQVSGASAGASCARLRVAAQLRPRRAARLKPNRTGRWIRGEKFAHRLHGVRHGWLTVDVHVFSAHRTEARRHHAHRFHAHWRT